MRDILISIIIVLLLIILFLIPTLRLLWYGLIDKIQSEKSFWKKISYDTDTRKKKFIVEKSQKRFIRFLKTNLNQNCVVEDSDTKSQYTVKSLTSLKNHHKFLEWDKKIYLMELK
ncbi:hypothetical protein ACRPKW_08870 [Pediococcus pentosaceus]|uniref:hypothetical protein n=1 Tax=Pediococcus pentosaceus TaxID=1255 RepID=UPI003D784E77